MAEEDRAAKQSELTLLMDEVERAQSRLLSLEREKVSHLSCISQNLKVTLTSLNAINCKPFWQFVFRSFSLEYTS